ncbi:carboxy terminal-processing peptidase [Marinicella litoralis]|uniref:Carboxyl-terminal processing protease n=1 Tax=Marinicella litoralis TaxID=644220 RepID=A0A4R6XUX6_9GAMM|nr:carboxy terminal-processing peptidase [Marinicella litoralis]TDR23646.1 carboxyl-terminal processing protease [Marinicella litoralis]
MKSINYIMVFWVASINVAFAKADFEPIKPSPKHTKESQLVVKLIEELHYKPSELDDGFSQKILDKFIATLDPNKMYFLGEDIVSFDRWRNELDDDLKKGDLSPAYEIFNLFKKRVAVQKEFASKVLDSEMNFETDDEYQWDREKAPWAIDQKELNEIWTKKVKNDYLSLLLLKKEPEKIKETLNKRYNLISKRIEDMKSDDVFQYFINSYLTLIEPHTGYMEPITSENFEINMKLSLEGIGAVLGNDGEYTSIQTIVKGGPADLEGSLKSGDKVMAVGQDAEGSFEDVVGWGIEDVVQLIRGEKGSTVRLRVIGEDDSPDTLPKTVSIVRDKVKLEQQAAQYQIYEVQDGKHSRKIGVIDIPTFYLDFAAYQANDKDFRSTTKDVKKILNKFTEEGVQGVIVDLRNNGGGSLYEAIQLSGLFIDKGPVVQTKVSYGKVEVKRDLNPAIAWDRPMVVMVNKLSASASEIFAAAMQDYGRAIIVGGQTYGKGTVQNIMPLNEWTNDKETKLGQLKMTRGQFFRINGGSTQNRGVIPDITFPASPGFENYGESSYENALPWNSIASSDYILFDDLSDEISYLRKRFSERSDVNFEFDFLKNEIELYNQEKDDVMVSLSAATREQKVKERKQRKKQRKEKRAAIIAQAQANPLLGKVNLVFDSKEALKSEDTKMAEQQTEVDAEDEEVEDFVDFRLHETARILSDFITLKLENLIAKSEKK